MTGKRVPARTATLTDRSDPGANRPQQERRKMRVIGGLGRGIARRLRRLGAADRRRARGRGRDRRGECRGGCLRLRAGVAARHRSVGVRVPGAACGLRANLRAMLPWRRRASLRVHANAAAVRLRRRTGLPRCRRPGSRRCLRARGMVCPISFSIAAIDFWSSGVTIEIAVPARPARPVRPMRWT